MAIILVVGLCRISAFGREHHCRPTRDSKNLGQWMGPIWQAHCSLAPVGFPNLLHYWEPNLGPIRERRCLP